ncbi:TPA: pilus assembly protein PilX [Pseudomonas aeruginosa]|nr:pilus assembly protein PilX [Pseudomonas aeruginosa]
MNNSKILTTEVAMEKTAVVQTGKPGINRKALAKKQAGFGAIEMIVVLIIVIGLLALAASRWDTLFGSNEAAEEISNVNMLMAGAKNLKTSSGYGTSGTNLVPALIKADAVPKNMTVTSSAIYNTWGGAVTVVSTGTGFTVTSAAIPEGVCMTLATKLASGGVYSTKMNSGTAIIGAVTQAAATSGCSSATSNTITWASNT